MRAGKDVLAGVGRKLALSCLALFCLILPWTPAGAAAQESAHDVYTQARFDLMDQNLASALQNVDRALGMDPRDARIIYLKLNILGAMKRPGQAEAFLKELLAQDPRGYGYLYFDLGYLYTDLKRHDQAAAQFRAAEKVDFPRAVKEQAQLFMRLKQYDQAAAALKRLPRETIDVKYLQAQILLKQEKFALARSTVNDALLLKPSPRQASDLKGLLTAIKGAERAARPWRASLAFLIQYDDNVFRDPLQDNPTLVSPGGKSDFAFTGRFNYSYRLHRTKKSSAGLTAALSNTSYFDLTDSNYAYWSVGGFYNFQGKKWGFRLPYEFAYYYSRSSLTRRLTSHSVYPTLYWDMTPRLRTEINGLLQRRLYFSPEPDITRWGLGAVHFLYFGSALKHLRLGYRVDQDIDSDKRSGYTAYQVALGCAWPIWGPFRLDAAATYTRYDHDERVEALLANGRGAPFARLDNQYGFALQLFYAPSDAWQLVLGYNYTYNDSNLTVGNDFDPYDFRQNLVWLMYSYNF